MPTFAEYLNEAYSTDMKKLIPSDKLKEIGYYLSTHIVSAQDGNFIKLPKNWKLSDLKDYEWCIFLLNDDTIAISKEGKIRHPYYHASKKIDETFKKEVKAVFGLNQEWSETVKLSDKMYKRFENKRIKDKLDDVQKKVKKLTLSDYINK